MKKKILAFGQRPFVRNVATIGTGVIVSQVIVLAFAPLITRLYGPEAIGLQGVFTSIVNLLFVVAALGYPASIVLPKHDSDAVGLVRISVIISTAICALTAITLSFVGIEFLALLNASAIQNLMYFIPLAMLVAVLAEILGQWLNRKKAFSVRAKYSVANALVVNGTKTAMGFYHPAGSTLIASNVFGGLFGTLLTWHGWHKYKKNNPNAVIEANETNKIDLLDLAKQHRSFPLLWTPQNLINVFSQSLPVLMLSSLFGAAYAGQYSIAIAVLALPANMIGGSVMSVFNPRINEAIHNGENARALIVKATLGMATMGALPYLAVIIAGPILFEFVFGKEWHTAGVYAQILAAWLFLQFANRPAVAAIPALKLQGGLLVYECFSTGSKVLALWLGFAYFKSDLVAVALFSFVGVLAYLWLILWVIKSSASLSNNLKEEASL